MKIMRWLGEKLFGAPRDVFREAVTATDEVTTRARSLRQQLEPFRLEDDPFAAIIRKQIITEAYESAQLSALHRGPLP